MARQKKKKAKTVEETTKEAIDETIEKQQTEPVLQRHIIGKETVLYKVGIKAGFSPEQIAGFDSEETLKNAIRRIKPGLIAEMEADYNAAAKKPLPSKAPETKKPKVLTFYTSIEKRMTLSANHAAMEEMQIQSSIRQKFIKQQDIQSISIVRSMQPDKKGMLISQVTVNYMA